MGLEMSRVPSRQARLAHAAKHAELWKAGKKDDWVASWRTICPGEVRMFDPVGTEEKHGFDAATSEAFDMFQSILKIKMITVQVNGSEMAWVCENYFGTEPNVQWLTASRRSLGTMTGTFSSRPIIRCLNPSVPTATLTLTCWRVRSSPHRSWQRRVPGQRLVVEPMAVNCRFLGSQIAGRPSGCSL